MCFQQPKLMGERKKLAPRKKSRGCFLRGQRSQIQQSEEILQYVVFAFVVFDLDFNCFGMRVSHCSSSLRNVL
jgi:hypothetical protein